MLTAEFIVWKYDYTIYASDFGEVNPGFSLLVMCECKKIKADLNMILGYHIASPNSRIWNSRPRDYPHEKVPANWNSLSYREKRNFIERHEDKHVYWYRIYFDAAVMLLTNLEMHTFSSDQACQSYADTVVAVLKRGFDELKSKQKEHDELWEKLK